MSTYRNCKRAKVSGNIRGWTAATRWRRAILLGCLGYLCGIRSGLGAESFPDLDEDMSGYRATPASGVVARLQDRLDQGQTHLQFEPRHGYLNSLLQELNIPPSSQLLVASKTSPNRLLISPHNPRALYFNNEVNVAYVPTADLLELAVTDPKIGVVFYTLEQKETERPKLHRDNRCLECHASSKTLDVPGLLVRSFLTQGDGDVDMLSGIMVNHRTPISRRWGGYYVTGTYGDLTHRGNLFGAEDIARHRQDPSYHSNLTDLSPLLDISKYPVPSSDIVALLVMDHQVHMQNLLTRLHRDVELALRHGESLEPSFPAFEATLSYLLLIDEAPLAAPVHGSEAFTRWYEQQGPRDAKGRSLHELDLNTRLLKHRCSPMIYSPSFANLPLRAKRHLYHRLWEVLTGEDKSPTFKTLPAATRQTIREIIIATQPDLPAYWRL